MEMLEELILELWEMFSEHLPASKRADLAVRYLKLLADHDIDLDELDDLKGEDEHIDHAFEQLANDEDNDDYDDHGDGYEDWLESKILVSSTS